MELFIAFVQNKVTVSRKIGRKDLYRKIPLKKCMKKLVLLTILLLSVSAVFAAAYDLQVISASEEEIVIEVSDLRTLDIQFVDQVEATAETSTMSDTYILDAHIERRDDKIVIVADVSPIFNDYSTVDAITVRGVLSVEGVQDAFAKRVSYRGTAAQPRLAPRRAPTVDQNILVFLVVAVAALVVILILVLLARKKPKKKRQKNRVKKKGKKRKARR